MRTKPTHNFRKLKKDDKMWMTSDGEIVPIAGMKCRHIFYAVKLLQNQSPMYKRTFGKEIEIPELMLKRYEECKEEIPEYYI